MPRPKKVVVENMPQITSENQGYCRICKKMLPANKFYQATNPMIDKNNLMSICIDHCKEIYNSYFTIYQNVGGENEKIIKRITDFSNGIHIRCLRKQRRQW